MNWSPITLRPYDPNPKPDGIPFVLTDRERSLAAMHTCQIEDHRRRQNEREARQVMATWTGELHRVR